MGSNVPNRGPELVGVNYAFGILALIAFGLRCYVRCGMVKGFKLDDWLMGCATVFFTAYAVSSTVGVHYGTGRHHADLPVEGVKSARHAWHYCYLFYSCSMVCSKMSIGFFLLRIAIRKLHTWIIYGAMAISVTAGLAFFFVTLFQCHPISFFWNKEQEGFCIDMKIVIALAYIYSAFSIITDFTFALLPTFLILNLQLARKTKIALIPLLTMGCIASSAVVARLPYLMQIGSSDFLWDTFDIAIWSTIEQGLAITAGSLATVRPLFTVILSKLGLASYTKQQTPIFGGVQSNSVNRIVGGHRLPHSRNDVDMLKLSSGRDVESGENEEDNITALPRNSNWYDSPLDRVRRHSRMKKEKNVVITTRDDGSEKSLKDKNETQSIGEERGMQIMVSKSFIVSDTGKSDDMDRGMR